jgi:hypothetical protein
LLAKRTNTIWPFPILKTVGGPKPILDGQPREGLNFGRGLNFQTEEQMGEEVAPKNYAL